MHKALGTWATTLHLMLKVGKKVASCNIYRTFFTFSLNVKLHFFFTRKSFYFSPVRLVPPERISFGINPAVATVTTVAEIRDQYNEVDSRLIAKEVLLFDQFWLSLNDTL